MNFIGGGMKVANIGKNFWEWRLPDQINKEYKT